MNRLLSIVAMVGALFQLDVSAQDLSVKGTVMAGWQSPTILSSSADAIVHPGDKVTVTVSGLVDINQELRSRERCDLLIFCKSENYTEHHFVPPGQVGVVIQVRPQGGGGAVSTVIAGDSPALLSVPLADATAFDAAYEIVAHLQGAGSSIDPNRSAGSFDVTIQVDAGDRARYFRTWLREASPAASRATGPAAIGQDLRAYGVMVAAALREFALARFPVPNDANKGSHEMLLRKAMDLAPADPENTLALARYFRAVGLDAKADELLAGVVSRLENNLDPRSRRQLGEAYMARMQAVLAKGGGVNPAASQSALAFVESAVQAYKMAQRPDLVSSAEFSRGRLLRGLRSRESLAAAIKAFNAALAGVPDVMSADDVLHTSDGKSLVAIKWTEAFDLSAMSTGPKSGDPRMVGQQPVAWDVARQKLLVHSASGLQWQSLNFNTPEAAPALAPGHISVGNGAILRIKDQRSADYVSRDQVMSAVAVGGTGVTICPSVAGFSLLPPITSASLSADGATIAIVCNGILRVFYYDEGGANQTVERQVAASAALGPIPFTVAGPALCGTLLISPPVMGSAKFVTTVTLLHGSSETQILQLPVAPAIDGQLAYVTPDRVSFGEDRVLVATSANEISSYRCSDGKLDTTIKLEKSSTRPPSDAAMVLRWLTADRLAVSRSWLRSVEVVAWANKEVSHFEFDAKMSDVEQNSASHMPLPSSVENGSPRMLSLVRLSELRAWPDSGQSPPIKVELPGWERPVLTQDGKNLLVQRMAAPLWIAQTDGGANPSEGAYDEVALDTMSPGLGWLSEKFDSSGMLNSISTVTAGGMHVNIPLPTSPQMLSDDTVIALKEFYEAWAKVTGAYDTPGAFPNKDIPKIIADPSLLRPMYAVPQWGFGAGAMRPFLTPNGPVPPIRSLSSARGETATMLCMTMQGKISASDEPANFAFPVPEMLFLLNASATGRSFMPVPPPPALMPPTPPRVYRGNMPMCFSTQVVRGRAPTVVTMINTPTGQRLFTLRPGGWAGSDVHAAPAAAWANADGSLLLLMSDTPSQGAPASKFSLIRLKTDGTSGLACQQCAGLPLLDAFTSTVPSGGGRALTIKEIAATSAGPLGMLLIDASGRFVARPDESEMIVISLTDGKVVRRTPSGRPLALTDHVLALDVGEGRVEFYEF